MKTKKQKYPGIDDAELESVKAEFGYLTDLEALITLGYAKEIAKAFDLHNPVGFLSGSGVATIASNVR